MEALSTLNHNVQITPSRVLKSWRSLLCRVVCTKNTATKIKCPNINSYLLFSCPHPLKQGLKSSRLHLKFLYILGWPWTSYLLASTSQVLKWQMCATTPCLCSTGDWAWVFVSIRQALYQRRYICLPSPSAFDTEFLAGYHMAWYRVCQSPPPASFLKWQKKINP